MSDTDTRSRTESDVLNEPQSFPNITLETCTESSGLSDILYSSCFPDVTSQFESRKIHPYTIQLNVFLMSTYSVTNSKLIPPTNVIIENVDIIKGLAEKFSVPPNCVIVPLSSETSEKIAVIVDRKCPTHNLFLLTICYNSFIGMKRLCCIGIDENMTVSELVHILVQKDEDQEKTFCLILQERIVESSTRKVIDLGLSNFAKCKCIQQLPVVIRFHYHITPKIEVLYYMDCINTDIVGEIKRKFCQQFENELPFVFQRNNEILFSYCTRILKDDDHLLFDDETNMQRLSPRAIENITIHTCHRDSIPIVAYFNNVQNLIVTQDKTSTEELRYQIGKHIKKNPNSLKLMLNKKKILDSVLVSLNKNCQINVKSSKKTTYQINIFYPNGSTSSESVDMYKNDTVLQLKNLLASFIGEQPFNLQLYHGGEMEDERRLREYHLKSDEKIEVVVYASRIEVLIRRQNCAEERSRSAAERIVIDDSSKTTVLQMKTYVSTIFDMAVSKMNIICNGKSLDNEDTLTEAGLQCYDTLFVCSFSHSVKQNDNGIFRLLFLDAKGVVHADNAVIYLGGKHRVIQDFEDLEEIPCTYQNVRQSQCSTKGIRLQKNRHNQDTANVFVQQRLKTVGSDRHMHMLALDMMHETKKTPMCSSPLPVPYQDNPREDLTTPVTTQTPCTSLQKTNTALIPFTGKPMKSAYYTETLRDKDGNVVASEMHQYHSVLPDANLGSFPTRSYSLPEFGSFGHTGLTRTTSQLSLQENPIKDEFSSIFVFLTRELGNDWQRFGLQMGLLRNCIDKCEYENPKNQVMQINSMLNCWKNKMGKSATKEELIKSLKQCELNNIAEQLEKFESTTYSYE